MVNVCLVILICIHIMNLPMNNDLLHYLAIQYHHVMYCPCTELFALVIFMVHLVDFFVHLSASLEI